MRHGSGAEWRVVGAGGGRGGIRGGGGGHRSGVVAGQRPTGPRRRPQRTHGAAAGVRAAAAVRQLPGVSARTHTHALTHINLNDPHIISVIVIF